MSDVAYQKIPGRGMRRAGWVLTTGKCSLWLGPDHLLAVETSGYTENYRRFFFRDIQAFTVQRTNHWLIFTALLGIPTALLVLGWIYLINSWSTGDMAYASIPLGIFTLLFGLPLLVNVVRGPTCVTRIHTAVQVEDLPSLGRLSTVRKTLSQLRAQIEAAQGSLAPEALRAGVAQVASSVSNPMARQNPDLPPSVRPLERYRSWPHPAMCWVAMVDLVGTPVTVAVGNLWAQAYSMIHLLALVIITITALVQQRGTDLPRGLRRLPVLFLIELVGLFLFTTLYGVVLAVTNPARAATMMNESPLDSPVTMGVTICSTLLNFGLGLWGILALRNYRRGPAPPATPGNPTL